MEDTDDRANCVAVGLGPDQVKPQAAIAGELVVAKQRRRRVVCRHKHVDVPVAVEVAERQASPDSRPGELLPGVRRGVPECPAAPIQEQMRRLRVPHVAANIPHRLVDVSVDHQDIESAVEIDVEETAAEAERAREGAPMPAWSATSS